MPDNIFLLQNNLLELVEVFTNYVPIHYFHSEYIRSTAPQKLFYQFYSIIY